MYVLETTPDFLEGKGTVAVAQLPHDAIGL